MAVTGRPSVITQEVLRKLEEAFSLGCTDLEACLYADISKSTLYDYQKLNPDFLERKEKLKEAPILLARKTVIQSLTNPQTAQWYLERKKKSEFATRVENTGADGQPVTHKVLGINYIIPNDPNGGAEVSDSETGVETASSLPSTSESDS